jgi:uncharacterized protein (DUF427 family)
MPNIILEQAGTPDHPITVERAPGPITLSVSGQSIADATNALILREGRYPPTYYIPKSALPKGLLQQASKVTHCPYKGDATHWKATLADGRTIDPIAWSYENPIQGITSIQGYLGFYTHAFDGAFDPPPR